MAGDSKVTKADVFELSRQVAKDINEDRDRIQGLAFTVDCVIAVLDEHFCPLKGGAEEKFQKPITKAVKAEIQRRIEAAKTKPPEPPAPTPKPALVCECCKTTVNVVEDGLYGVYCHPCLNDISTIGECANTHLPPEQTPFIDVP